MALPWGAEPTVDDVWALPDDWHRNELVDGVPAYTADFPFSVTVVPAALVV